LTLAIEIYAALVIAFVIMVAATSKDASRFGTLGAGKAPWKGIGGRTADIKPFQFFHINQDHSMDSTIQELVDTLQQLDRLSSSLCHSFVKGIAHKDLDLDEYERLLDGIKTMETDIAIARVNLIHCKGQIVNQ
jgi:hypothetical protein